MNSLLCDRFFGLFFIFLGAFIGYYLAPEALENHIAQASLWDFGWLGAVLASTATCVIFGVIVLLGTIGRNKYFYNGWVI